MSLVRRVPDGGVAGAAGGQVHRSARGTAVVELTDDPALQPVADEARQRLGAALAALDAVPTTSPTR